jgi:hypothetical protein
MPRVYTAPGPTWRSWLRHMRPSRFRLRFQRASYTPDSSTI